ncbi:MAG: hypothetical protein ACRDV3_04635 [Acidothermaceae bacterium]
MNPVLLIFAAVFGFAAWQEANRFGKRYGRTPWGWHPAVWGVVCFLSIVIGVILLAIAERVGKKATANREKAATQPWGQTPPEYVTPPFGDVTFGPPTGAPSAMQGPTSNDRLI